MPYSRIQTGTSMSLAELEGEASRLESLPELDEDECRQLGEVIDKVMNRGYARGVKTKDGYEAVKD